MHKLKRLWQVLCLPKVSSVVVQLKSSEISKGMSVRFLVIGNNVCTLPDSGQGLGSPAFHCSILSNLSISLMHYSGVGFVLLSEMQKRGKEMEPVPQILELDLELLSVGL